MVKKLKFTLFFLLVATITFAQESPRKQAIGKVGEVTVTVDYGAPSVKGRTIWGGLEEYGMVWRAGANENTTISFDTEVKIGTSTVPAGKYGFFIIPNKNNEWVLILNKKNNGWGAYSYTKDDDLLRMNTTPTFVDNTQEVLEYTIVKKGVILSWGKAKVLLPVN